MSETIAWSETTSGGGKKRKFWGTTNASDDEQIIAAFAEQWRKVFADVLSAYSPDQWNCLMCAVVTYEGTFDLGPLQDFDLKKSLPGCHLKFDSLEGTVQADFDSDDEFEEVCQAETKRFVDFLVRGWEEARKDAAIVSMLQSRRIPFRVIDSPEPKTRPLLELVLGS